MDEKKLKEYLAVAPADFSHAPEFGLYNWARREVLRKRSIINEEMKPAPKYFFDGREIKPGDITNYLNIVDSELNQL